MGTNLSLELGKVKSGEEEEWHPTSVTPLPVQIGSLTATSSTTMDNLYTFKT